jgi:hypothetical protein
MSGKPKLARAILIVIAALAAWAPTIRAQEQPDEANLSVTYNEEAVRKLLEKADPDIAFFARLKMMRGHLSAAVMMAGLGSTAEAREHVKHPSSEILPEIDGVLKERGLADLAPALDAVAHTLHGKDMKLMTQAIEQALVQIAKSEDTVPKAKLQANGILPDAIVLLLRTAVVEYNEAFEYGKIVNLVEYHDGAAFVREARKLLEGLEPALAARDAPALEKIKQSWNKLETAWPSAEPPKAAVLPVSKLLALVTIIELQLNKLRGGA